MLLRLSRTALVLSLALLPVGLVGVGCTASNVNQLRMHPSPELATTGRTQGQVNNHVAITADTLLRTAHEDLLRAMLLTDRNKSAYTLTP